jgi:hypothetical protein
MHDVPRETLGEHLGFVRPTEDEAYDQLDEDIARESTLALIILYLMISSRSFSHALQDAGSRGRFRL